MPEIAKKALQVVDMWFAQRFGLSSPEDREAAHLSTETRTTWRLIRRALDHGL